MRNDGRPEGAGIPRARMTPDDELSIIASGWAKANGRDRTTEADYRIAERVRGEYRSRGAVLAWEGQRDDPH